MAGLQIEVRKPTAAERARAGAWEEWSKEPSTFAWSYDTPETGLILEGRVRVAAQDGSCSASFSPGDGVVFPAGLKCVWTDHEAIHKKYRFG